MDKKLASNVVRGNDGENPGSDIAGHETGHENVIHIAVSTHRIRKVAYSLGMRYTFSLSGGPQSHSVFTIHGVNRPHHQLPLQTGPSSS